MTEIVRPNTHSYADQGSGFVLVVDNDAESLVIMAMILQRLGFRVCTANFADKAIEMSSFSRPSLVISELDLRGMTGLALMHRLRDEKGASAPPVIIMIRESTAEIEQRCRQAGAAGCLPKPVQADDLYRAVSRIVDPQSRRADVRIPTSLPASVNDRKLDAASGECVTNLSVNGMYLRANTVHRVQEQVRVELVLHGESVTADARVVYCHAPGEERGGRAGMGLQFLTLSPGGREIIRRFIHREVTHGLAPGMS